jgi:hypothetical protein
MDHDCHDDGRHFITEKDRLFLYGNRDMTEGAISNTRTRIRERIRCALDDLTVLARAPEAWNLNHFTRGMGSNQDDERYRGIVHTLSLMYNMADSSETDTERVFEEAIREATFGVADVDVSIDVDYPPKYDRERILEKLERGDVPDPWEIGMLYYQGHTDVLEENLQVGEETYNVGDLLKEQAPKRLSDIDRIEWRHDLEANE